MKTFLILSILILSVYSQNLIRCFQQIGYTLLSGAKLALAIKSKDPKAAALSIKDIALQISPMINECTSPICLTEAKKRCEKDTGQQCEQWGAIMYPKCAPGYIPFGCCLCVQPCPSGFRDDGLFCAKPASYGRGAGYPWQFGDWLNLDGAWNRCNAQNKQTGCEQNGLIIYPKCAEGYHSAGCCICSPNCPAGMKDIGVSCYKTKSYGRGAGYPMHYSDCSKQHESNEQSGDNQELNTDQLEDQYLELYEKLDSNKKNFKESSRITIEICQNISHLDQQFKKLEK